MSRNKAQLIFEKWKADLASKERSHKYVEGNFDDLFSTLHKSKIPFDEAYELLSQAIQEHYPSKENVKFTYRRIKMSIPSKTEIDFEKEWKQTIEATGKRVFYSLYPIDGEVKEEEQQYGSMSPVEYRKQRAYADSYPRVDLAKIREERQKLIEELEKMEQLGANDE
jgi:hypothetical protein